MRIITGNQTNYDMRNANEWRVFQNKHYEDCLIGIRKIFDDAFLRGYRCGIQEAVAQTYTETPVPETDHIPEATKKVDRTMIAAMAMQGLLNATSVERFSLRIKPEAIAKAAVEYADALIAELNKGKDESERV